MNLSSTASPIQRAPSAPRRERQEMIHTVVSKLAFLTLVVMSALELGGCRAVEAVFKVGVWFGVLIMIAIIAAVGGIAAMIMRKP